MSLVGPILAPLHPGDAPARWSLLPVRPHVGADDSAAAADHARAEGAVALPHHEGLGQRSRLRLLLDDEHDDPLALHLVGLGRQQPLQAPNG